MNSLESLSLSDFQSFRPLRPDLADFADFVLAQTYEDFITVLYQDIDRCISVMESNPDVRKKDGEDRLTEELKGFLIAKGYKATHDEFIRGHCDLIVRQHNKPYTWLGEAKIHKNSHDYLKQGFNQLSTRYSNGTTNSNQGGMLIYIRNKNAARVVENWKKHLSKCHLKDYSEKDCPSRPKLAFFSKHCHDSSGLPFTVRHMAIVLHFSPKDKKQGVVKPK